MLHDLRYAMRTLRRTPGFAVSAILALALGIGANTAVFSLIDAVLLEPLPYTDPDRLVRLYERNVGDGTTRGEVSPGTFVDWRQRSRTLDGLAVFTRNEALWSFGDRFDVITFSAVSPALFDVMRVRPILGRTFRPESQQTAPGDVDEVIISFDLWQRRFAGDRSVVGRTVSVESRFPLTIIGVMPARFSFPPGVDAWGNLAFLRPIQAMQRQMRYYDAVARLAPGVTVADARSELAGISAQLAADQPRSNAGWTAGVEPLADSLTGDARPGLLALFGAVCGVLLIACANVANLLLARATARRRELAVRAALGAGARRLMRQTFTEVLLLTTAGTALALVIGSVVTRLFIRLAPPDVPRLSDVHADGRLLLFAASAGLVSAALVGLVPALQARRAERSGGLRPDLRSASDPAARLRRVLIAGETALVVLLLTGALLLIRTFVKLRAVDLGFQATHVLSVEMRWPTGRFIGPPRRPWAMVQESVDGLVNAVATLPGVAAAAVVTDVPLTGSAASGDIWRADAPGASGSRPPASARDLWKGNLVMITPDYFRTLGIPLLRGRNITASDRLTAAQLNDPGQPRAGVAVINDAFAHRYFPSEDPIGRRVVVFDDLTFCDVRTIVGVVADIRSDAVTQPAAPTIFVPHAEHPDVFRPTIVVRSSLPPATLVPAIRERVRTFDPRLLVMRARPLNEIVSGALSKPRFNLLLVGGFALLALTLSAVGIYGVVAFTVSQRTREIGVRMALGARPGDVRTLVLSDGLAPVLAGALIGLGAAAVATRALRTMVFGVTPLDPVSFALSPVVLIGVAALACLVPARRAIRVDPMVVLRDE